MNVNEALVTAQKIGAPVNVPNHYDMFESNSEDPEKFTKHIYGGFIMEFNTEYILTAGGFVKQTVLKRAPLCDILSLRRRVL